MKRIPDLKTQNEDIRTFIAHSDDFVETKFNPAIDKAFAESVSLAVTQVNGCSICSYAHTKNALKAGMTEDEIESLLDGGFDHAPKQMKSSIKPIFLSVFMHSFIRSIKNIIISICPI